VGWYALPPLSSTPLHPSHCSVTVSEYHTSTSCSGSHSAQLLQVVQLPSTASRAAAAASAAAPPDGSVSWQRVTALTLLARLPVASPGMTRRVQPTLPDSTLKTMRTRSLPGRQPREMTWPKLQPQQQ
jgi:hypothetical protein